MLCNYLKEFFNDFPEETIEKIAHFSYTKKLNKGNVLFFEGEEPVNLYLIIDGVASVYKTYENGAVQVLKYFYPLTLIAELANIQNIPYPASCRCEEDAKFIVIDYIKFQQLFSKNPLSANEASVFLLQSIASKLFFHMNENNLRPMKNISILQRIAGMLLQDKEYFNRTKRWKAAQDLCISSETLSRNLSRLKAQKAIKIEKSIITIIDENILENIQAGTLIKDL